MEENSTSAVRVRSLLRRPPIPKVSPWLVFPNEKGKKSQAFYNVSEPNKKTYKKFIPEMSRKSFWQSPSHQGWLIILCNNKRIADDKNSIWKFGDCFLWNPVSLETIELPSLINWISSRQYLLCNCVLSSPPCSINDHDSMVFFLFDDFAYGNQVLLYCRPGDKHWMIQELNGSVIGEFDQSLIYFKDKLFIISATWIFEIKRKLGFDNGDEYVNHETLTVRSHVLFPDPFFQSQLGNFLRTHYVETSDDIFKIKKHYSLRSFDKIVRSIQVLRMNFSKMEWEEVKSLGDHVLFLGENTTACCSATELGFTRGCIYYTLPGDKSLYKFDLEGQSISVFLPCLKLPSPWFSPEWVMIMNPTFRVSDGSREENVYGEDGEEETIIEAKKSKNNRSMNEKEDKGESNNAAELEEAGPNWGMFSQDILELIASYLHPVDYTHYRSLCRVSRSVLPALNWSTSSTKTTETTSLSPWLVFSEDNESIYKFVDPMHNNEKYLINVPELLKGATIRFSKGGWLLMSKGRKTIFFYNPFTKVTIQLPDLHDRDYVFYGISFSSSPTSSDCIIFAVTEWLPDVVMILFLRRGDTFWRWGVRNTFDLPVNEKQTPFKPCLNNPVFYDGAFYCLDYNGTLGVFNTLDDMKWKILAKPQKCFDSKYPSFLVECEGKLLLVDLGHIGKSVQVFRLDSSKKIWHKVESLGKHVLFISYTSCFSLVAPNRSMENRIYFPRLYGERILFYSLDTDRHHFDGIESSTNDFYGTREQLNCSWIEPNWSKTSIDELHWPRI